MNISNTDARPLFTNKLAATFSDRVKPKAFFRSFFTEVDADTKLISIEVERDSQSVAVDVMRGNDGNRNTWDKSTGKTFLPPYYNEFFDVTDLDLYDALYVEQEISAVNFGKFLKLVEAKLEGIMDKIDRAYELQAAQALVDGIVQLKNGINIDFKRKAASLVAYNAATDWSISTVDPNVSILAGATFLKQTGKMEGNVVNAILGESVFTNYINNPFVKGRALAVQYGLDQIVPAQATALGASFHGEISVGSYRVRLWVYPEVYKDPATGTTTPYMHTKKMLMLPEKTNNVITYAAVPQLIFGTGIVPKQGKFLVYDFIDNKRTVHEYGVKSAGVCIPVAVDQAYTIQILS